MRLLGTARARIEFEIMTGMLALLRSSIGAFLGWWFGELAGLMPRRLRQQGRRERRGPVLSARWAASIPMRPITTSV